MPPLFAGIFFSLPVSTLLLFGAVMLLYALKFGTFLLLFDE